MPGLLRSPPDWGSLMPRLLAACFGKRNMALTATALGVAGMAGTLHGRRPRSAGRAGADAAATQSLRGARQGEPARQPALMRHRARYLAATAPQ
jgi:hypothetical protein